MIPKHLLGEVDPGIRQSTAHDDHRDSLIAETILFGKYRTGITENNSKTI